jgi:hypothetical protein
MRVRRTVRDLAVCTSALGIALLWPGPAGAAPSTDLGGYTGTATAAVVHIELFEPTIPVPTTPQGDMSYTYSNTTLDTGPSTRALASWLWPGAALGDGLDAVTGNPQAKYPVQVNSRYPATASAPATNSQAVVPGSGMNASTDGYITTAHTAIAGTEAAPGTSSLPIIGSLPIPVPSLPSPPAITVPAQAAALVSSGQSTSTATIALGTKTVTSTAHAAASDISLLAGLIEINNVSVTAKVSSDGKNATTSGSTTIGGITIAGNKLALDDKGVNTGSSATTLPALPSAVTDNLAKEGFSVSATPVTRTVNGASGELSTTGLVITVDTAPLKSALNGPLGTIISQFPASAQSQLAVLINLGPKLVFRIGDVDATAVGSPAYIPPPFNGGGGSGGGGSSSGGGTTGGSTGGGTVSDGGTGGGSVSAGGTGTGTGTNTGPTGGGAPGTFGSQPAAQALPPLGDVPRMYLIGTIAIAGVLGWLLRMFGGQILGAAGSSLCMTGRETGVPDLRKG